MAAPGSVGHSLLFMLSTRSIWLGLAWAGVGAGVVCAGGGGALGGAVPDATVAAGVRARLRHERAEWAYRQRAYPAGRIPAGALLRAWQASGTARVRPAALTGSLPAQRWVNIGPAPILSTPDDDDPDSVGRVTCLAVDPADSTHWLIGAAQGGVWETHDAGTTWAPRTDDQPSLAMGAITFAPSNPQIAYAGTGEMNGGDSYAGAGLLKSTDGGSTWQLLATATFAQISFSRLRVSPANPNVLLAATANDNNAFDGHSPLAPPPTGVCKSVDGGVTWTLTLGGKATDLEVDPGNFNHFYAGLGDPAGDPTNGVYQSLDGGQTWTALNGPWLAAAGGVGRVGLAVAPSNPNILYVSMQDSTSANGNLLGVWQTADAWDPQPIWSQLPYPGSPDGQWDYGQVILTDPSDPSTVYLGGIDLWQFDGANWTDLYPRKHFHVDQHALAWAGGRLVVGDDGGVFSTPDGGVTWRNHNTATLAITQFYAGSVHPRNPAFALGDSQDQGVQAWNGGRPWQELLGGDGTGSAISASHPDTDWAGSVQNLALARTTDGGVNFDVADTGISTNARPYLAPFAKCPAKDDEFIAGVDNLWRCDNFFSGAAPLWALNGPTDGSLLDGSEVSAVAFAPSDTQGRTYAFGTSFGQLFVTSTGGATWNDIAGPSPVMPPRFLTGLAFSPTNANLLFATFSGFDETTTNQPGHLFVTANALAPKPSWRNLSPPADVPHNGVTLDPSSPSTLYVATDLGVWTGSADGSNWSHMGPAMGLPNVAVYDVEIGPQGRIVAFTHGRGAFALVDAAPPALQIAPTTNQVLLAWPALTVNYLLQTTAHLSPPAAWATVTNAPAVVGKWNTVTLPPTAPTAFYRLMAQ